MQEIYLIRHGETEWSLNGRHTGVSDIALTENGRRVARQWQPYAVTKTFDLVLTSPLQRAQETCTLAGLGERAQIDRDLMEWDYGAYEGLTPQEIRARQPAWMIFNDGCPGGESPEMVGARVDRVIARLRAVSGDAAVFAHGRVESVCRSLAGSRSRWGQSFPARNSHPVRPEFLSRSASHKALERPAHAEQPAVHAPRAVGAFSVRARRTP